MIKAFVRRLTPRPIISFYHRLLAELAAVVMVIRQEAACNRRDRHQRQVHDDVIYRTNP